MKKQDIELLITGLNGISPLDKKQIELLTSTLSPKSRVEGEVKVKTKGKPSWSKLVVKAGLRPILCKDGYGTTGWVVKGEAPQSFTDACELRGVGTVVRDNCIDDLICGVPHHIAKEVVFGDRTAIQSSSGKVVNVMSVLYDNMKKLLPECTPFISGLAVCDGKVQDINLVEFRIDIDSQVLGILAPMKNRNDAAKFALDTI